MFCHLSIRENIDHALLDREIGSADRRLDVAGVRGSADAAVVATTGKCGRELFTLADRDHAVPCRVCQRGKRRDAHRPARVRAPAHDAVFGDDRRKLSSEATVQHLQAFVQNYGAWVYALLFLIIFTETGVVVMPFLPGDSLLFVAGLLRPSGGSVRFKEREIAGLGAPAVSRAGLSFHVAEGHGRAPSGPSAGPTAAR